MSIEEKFLARLEEKDEWIAEIEESLTRHESQLNEYQVRVQSLEQTLHELRSSGSYRLALRLARAMKVICASARYQLKTYVVLGVIEA